MDKITYPPGTLLVLEEGEYSDFGIHGIFVTLCELDLDAEAESWIEYEKEVMKQQVISGASFADTNLCRFTGWLCQTQKLASANYSSRHIGSHGTLEVGEDVSLFDLSEEAEQLAAEALANKEPSNG